MGLKFYLKSKLQDLPSLNPSYFNLFYSNFEKYLSETKNLYAHQRNIEVFNQRYKLDIKKDFFSWIGNDVCAFVTEGNQDNVMQNYAVAIHIKDIEMADASLQKILNATKGKKEVLNYLNYKKKKRNIIDDIIQEPLVEKEQEKEEEKDDVIKRYELSYNTKKLNELLDEVIIIMNQIKSLN